MLLPIGGVLADRLGPRPVAMAAALVSGDAQLSIGLLLLGGHIDFLLIAVAAAVKGVAGAFDAPATLPLVVGTTDDDGRQAANALMGIAGSATNLAGPALAGVLIFTVGAGWAFVLDAATFGFSAGTLALIKVRPVHVPRKSLRGDLAAGWAEVRTRTWYWTSLIGHATWNFAAGLLATTGRSSPSPSSAARGSGSPRLQASAVGYLAGAFIAGRTRVSRAILVGNIALMSYAVPLALFAVAAPAWAVVVCVRARHGLPGVPQPGMGNRRAAGGPAGGPGPRLCLRLARFPGRDAPRLRPRAECSRGSSGTPGR